MALSETQKAIIEQSIVHLINPPETANEFSQYEKNLFELFTGRETANEELAQLWQCFNDPTKYFKNLENLGPAPTISEVKLHTLEYITNLLEAKKITIKTWQPQQIIDEAQAKADWNETFKTKHETPQDDYNPWVLNTSDDMIFSGYVGHDEGSIIDDETQEEIKIVWPYVKVTLNLPESETVTKKLRFDSSIMQADFGVTIDQESYTRKTLASAYSMAALYACKAALEYAANKGIDIASVPDEMDEADLHEDYVLFTTATCILLTKKYYLTQLVNQTIPCALLRKVHIDQSILLMKEALINCAESNLPGLAPSELLTYPPSLLEKLASQNVLALMQHAKLSITEVKQLTSDHLKIISHPIYYAKILCGELTIADILALNHDETSMLFFPIVSNLIQLNKLTCNEVLHWPPHLKSFFSDTRFGELISHNLHDLDTLQHLNLTHIRFLQIKSIYGRFIAGDITLKNISELPDSKINLILESKLLTKWLETNILSYEEVAAVSTNEPLQIRVKGMINSLFNVQHPEQNKNLQDENWIGELQSAADECRMELNSFIPLFAFHFALESREYLNQSLIDIDTTKLDPWLLKLNVLLNGTIDQDNTYWVSFYDEAAQYGHMILTKMRMNRFIDEDPNETSLATQTSLFVKQDINQDSRISHRLKLVCHTLEKMAHLTSTIIHMNKTRESELCL